MTIYEKLQKIKSELASKKLKKSKFNNFGNFHYYDLSDIMPPILELCEKYKLCTNVSFTESEGILAVYNLENLEEQIFTKIPIEKFENSKMNKIQIIGWITTYIRRYLYLTLFDIVEDDTFDATIGKKEEPKKYCCVDCNAEFKPFTSKEGKKFNAGQVYHMAESSNPDKKARCRACKLKKEGAKQNGFV